MANEYVDDLYNETGYILGDDNIPTYSIILSKNNNILNAKLVDPNNNILVANDDINILLSNKKNITIYKNTSETTIKLDEVSKIESIEGQNILEVDIYATETIIDGKKIKLSDAKSNNLNTKTIEVIDGVFDETLKIKLTTGENIYLTKGDNIKNINIPINKNIEIKKIYGDIIPDIIPRKINDNEFTTVVSDIPKTIYFLDDEDTSIEELGLNTDDLIVDKKNPFNIFTMVTPTDKLISFKDLKNELPLQKINNIGSTVEIVKPFTDIDINKFDLMEMKKQSKIFDRLKERYSISILDKKVVTDEHIKINKELLKIDKNINNIKNQISKTSNFDEINNLKEKLAVNTDKQANLNNRQSFLATKLGNN